MSKAKFLLRCLISVALLAFVARKVNWHGLASILVRVHLSWAALGSTLTLLLIASLALRWSIFLRQQKIALPFPDIFSLTWAGQFFNSVLPGSTGGDFIKIFQLCRISPDRKAAAAASVLVDRFSASVALLALAFAAILMDPAPLRDISPSSLSLRAVLAYGLGAILLAVVGGGISFQLIRRTHWLGRLQRTLSAFRDNLTPNAGLAAASTLALCTHLLNFFVIYLFARSLGISVTYPQILLMMPVILFLVMIPVTVNGHGLREMLLIYYFKHLHVTLAGQQAIGVNETAIALSLLMVTNDLLWSLPGGLCTFSG